MKQVLLGLVDIADGGGSSTSTVASSASRTKKIEPPSLHAWVVDEEGGRPGGCLSLPAEELGALAAACEGSYCLGGRFLQSSSHSRGIAATKRGRISPPAEELLSLPAEELGASVRLGADGSGAGGGQTAFAMASSKATVLVKCAVRRCGA